MVPLQKGIPIPPPAVPVGTIGRPPKYRWAEMEVGDSFAVDDVGLKGMRESARYQSNKSGRQYLVALDDSGRVRVWRTA